jgi:hypothetical protein
MRRPEANSHLLCRTRHVWLLFRHIGLPWLFRQFPQVLLDQVHCRASPVSATTSSPQKRFQKSERQRTSFEHLSELEALAASNTGYFTCGE